MPQSDTISLSRRRAAWRVARKANGIKVNDLVTGQTPGTSLVNGAFHRKRCPAAVGGAGDSRPAGTPSATKPPSTSNDDEAKKTAPPKKLRRRGVGRISALTDVPVNRSIGPQDLGFRGSSDREAPDANESAEATNQKRRKKFRWKKSNHELANPADSRLHLMSPHVEENWEKEMQEVSLDSWEMCFGSGPYGPDDVLNFDLWDLTLKQTAIQPVAAYYRPASHHPKPVNMTHYRTPTVPGQFEDADE